MVLGESIGTFDSDGCPTVGDRVETLGTKAVIDWLNGRARASTPTGAPVSADWTTGAVGMVGVSYNGTLPNQVATTGVEGLKTIVPISAISSWYDYYRANGLVVAPHSEIQGVGENGFLGEDTDVLASFIGGSRMRARRPCPDTLNSADPQTGPGDRRLQRVLGARATTSTSRRRAGERVRGPRAERLEREDQGVREWWYRLAVDVPRKLWLHNGGHGGPPAARRRSVQGHREPLVRPRAVRRAQRHPGEPRAARSSARTAPTTTRPTGLCRARARPSCSFGAERDRAGRRSPAPRTVRRDQDFVDEGATFDTDDVLIQGPDGAGRTGSSTARPRSRQRRPHQRDAVGRPDDVGREPNAANLTAVLVDYGPAGSADPPVMVTRGWLDPQNRLSPGPGVRSARAGLRPPWDLQPDDYIFQAGHRIGLVVVSTDHDYTIRPDPGTRLTLLPVASHQPAGGRRPFGAGLLSTAARAADP